jgi:methionyl-tRNA synthetase
LTQFPFGQDGDIQEERLVEKYNSDLANDLGNLVSRVVQMIKNYTQGKIPKSSKYEKEDEEIKNLALTTPEEVFALIEEVNINQAIDRILKLVRNTNKYVEAQAPWNLVKNKQTERLNTVLYTAAEVLRIISDLFFPILPNKAKKIKEILGLNSEELKPSLENAEKWDILKPDTQVGSLEILFPRIQVEKNSKIQERKQMPEEISIEDFAKCDFRVAKILNAERVEGANKLLKLQIEIGEEKRQIVAGIAEYYKPEELLNKEIIVLANLKPAKIRGIESNGMLLAAKDEKSLALLTVDKEIKTGSKIS